MIPAAFEYTRPTSLDEALVALADPDAKAMAGGHSLVPVMKLRLARPSLIVDLAGLGLRGVELRDDVAAIGALTTYAELLRAPDELPAALREAAAAVGDVQVRNAGTVGGAVAHADPASDLAAALLALQATLRLRSLTGLREVAIADFFLGPFQTALGQQELLEEIVVPRHDPGSAYVTIEDPSSGYALVGVAVVVGQPATLGLTGIAGQPLVASLETDSDEAIAALVETLPIAVQEDELDYRQHLIRVTTRRALDAARTRANGANG